MRVWVYRLAGVACVGAERGRRLSIDLRGAKAIEAMGEPLELRHRDELRAIIRRYRPGLSEYSFANLYLFRATHRYHFHRGDLPLISGVTYDGRAHLMPLFDWSTDRAEVVELARRWNAILYPVAEADLFEAAGLGVSDNAEDADYLYSAGAMAAYRGALLKPKRQLAMAFELSARPTVEPADAANAPELLRVLEGWLSDVQRPIERTDYAASLEAIEHREALGLFGLLARDAAGEPLAFVLASEVADDMAAVHFAKARRHPAGALPFLFRAFAREHGRAYPVLNFEQDLGNPGFRQNKRSFAPMRLARKYRLAPVA